MHVRESRKFMAWSAYRLPSACPFYSARHPIICTRFGTVLQILHHPRRGPILTPDQVWSNTSRVVRLDTRSSVEQHLAGCSSKRTMRTSTNVLPFRLADAALRYARPAYALHVPSNECCVYIAKWYTLLYHCCSSRSLAVAYTYSLEWEAMLDRQHAALCEPESITAAPNCGPRAQ